MNILIATDSFKDALPALEVCKAIERGVQKAKPFSSIKLLPLGDGGEGTAEVLTWCSGGDWKQCEVHDPLLRATKAYYGITKEGLTAFIEMAQASGLQLLKEEERNCLKTSTYGTGELIRKAIAEGARKIILGIGGSATNDVGIGMAAALGFRFYDKDGVILAPVGENLRLIHSFDDFEAIDLSKIEIQVLCDVENPLYGPNGAAYTYARQKGADESELAFLDQGAKHFANVVKDFYRKDFAHQPGAGAAGGLGAGAMAFLNAKLTSGINFVLDYLQFDQALQSTDLLITGEGKIDHQTLQGKLIQGLCKRAQQFEVPVIAICGTLLAKPDNIKSIGLEAAFSILDRPMSLEEALKNTAACLEQTAFNVMSIWKK